MNRTSRWILIIVIIGSSFLSGFTYRDVGIIGVRGALAGIQLVPGSVVSAVRSELAGSESELSVVDTYSAVAASLDASYYGTKPELKDLTYAAIRGMLATFGDRYTRFLEKKDYERIQQENRGDFEGIGAVLDIKEGRIFIEKPLKNTPAMRAGLQPGDIILRVDDQLIQGLDITKVVDLIRGEPGSKVKITIKREGVPEPLEFEIVRETIPFTIVEWKMEDDAGKIGYIALKQFNEQSDEQFDAALTELESLGMKGLVLDLRGNPGGLLDVAVDICSRFVAKGNVVIVQNKGGRRTAVPTESSKHNHRVYPLAVLINGRSASASEIVAGAIRDHKAGTLVGSDTFGKGLIQTIINLQDGSAVSITTAKYLTPAGRDVSKEKVHPDVVIEQTEEDIRADNDVQLKRAVQLLRERLGATQANLAEQEHRKS
jgi:carboxyl-terminal processing protease